MKRIIRFSIILIILSISAPVYSQNYSIYKPGEILQRIEKLNKLGCVMYIAAHPDDENTRLLSYLSNERKFRTVYLSLTRGDGGQNLIGTEQGALLGMIRTQELMAARRTDGAEQWFSRCVDFGYSKNPEETFSKWNREDALSDVVWAIRKFRPDVIITRFPSNSTGGHGHHTASAILAEEAFVAAGDPKRFPEQLQFVEVWKPVRLFFNSFNFRFRPPQDFAGQIQIDVGGYNPLLGSSYGEIASMSTSNHKSQGFGVARRRGVQYEYLQRTMGDTAVAELFANIDSTWNRITNQKHIPDAIDAVIKSFNIHDPSASIPGLLEIRKSISDLKNSVWRSKKLNEIDELIIACSGLWFEVNPEVFYATIGDSVQLKAEAIARNYDKIKLSHIRIGSFDTLVNAQLDPNVLMSYETTISIPADAAYSNPYWLSSSKDDNMFVTDKQEMRGLPWNNSKPSAAFSFTVNGTDLTFEVPLTYKWTDPVKGECYRPFEIVPPVTLSVPQEVMTFTSDAKKEIPVLIKSYVDNFKGKLNLMVPQGWKVEYENKEIEIPSSGNELVVKAYLTPPVLSDASVAGIDNLFTAEIEYEGKKYNKSMVTIEHEHIPQMVTLQDCKVKLVAIDLQTAVTKIGYINGAGDKIADCLRQAGFIVDELSEETVRSNDLSDYDAIITGIRAYNTIENIGFYYNPLMNYIKKGGTLVVQYNTRNFVSSLDVKIGPYDFEISRNRVTDENARVRFIDKKSELLNVPNKITTSDFDGWVQERGLYFAENADPHYKKLIEWNDKDEDPLDGGLIYTPYGDGVFIYTGISFFRQLPAGVPGAYKLLANLINAGKIKSK